MVCWFTGFEFLAEVVDAFLRLLMSNAEVLVLVANNLAQCPKSGNAFCAILRKRTAFKVFIVSRVEIFVYFLFCVTGERGECKL